MAHQSIALRTATLDRILLSSDRYADCRLEVRASTGETLLTVGGRWMRLGKRYEGNCPARVIVLKKSQDEIGRGLAEYVRKRLAGDESRIALMLAIGNRGGGKTWFCALTMVVLALAIPGAWQIGVSITSKQNREMKDAISQIVDPAWIANEVDDFRDPRTEFITGSTILWLTSKNHKALRQAQLSFEHVCVNEGQDQREKIFINSISATRNSGGLMSVATNPPQDESGEGDWVAVLYQGLEAGNQDGAAYILDSRDNDAVNQAALGKIGRLMRLVNPDAADADSVGIIKLAGTVGYPGFTRIQRSVDVTGRWLAGHIGRPPDIGWTDITREITAEHVPGSSSGYDYVGGGDFQTDPGSCAVVGKLYRTQLGEVVLWIKEFIATSGTEEDLTLALTSHGYYPGHVDYEGRPAASLLLIGDATGARQNAEHRKRDPYSFTRLRADGWSVLPPSFYGPKKTPWNPLIADSRKQMKAALQAGLIVLSPECSEPSNGFPSLIESMARAKVTVGGKFVKKGHYTHGPDGVRYLAWRFLPRAQPPAIGAPDQKTADAIRSMRLITSG